MSDARSNKLLSALPAGSLRGLAPRLEPVTLYFGDVLLEPQQSIEHVYFPSNAVVSLLIEEDRRTVEIGMVGYEGMVGLPLALGAQDSHIRAVVQGSGTATRMTRARFLRHFRSDRRWRRRVYRYSHSLMAQVARLSACNRLHPAQARLARWLLMTGDRLRSREFNITHAYLGHVLGVRRVRITQAAGALQEKGLISYSRGRMRLLARPGLEAAACSCYQVIRKLYDEGS